MFKRVNGLRSQRTEIYSFRCGFIWQDAGAGWHGANRFGSCAPRPVLRDEDIYHNRRRRAPEENGAIYADFFGLLEQSDFIVALIPLSNDSRGLFGRQAFAKMKKTAFFINAARGAIADTKLYLKRCVME